MWDVESGNCLFTYKDTINKKDAKINRNDFLTSDEIVNKSKSENNRVGYILMELMRKKLIIPALCIIREA